MSTAKSPQRGEAARPGVAATTIRFQRPELPPAAEIERYFAAARRARWYSNGGPCHELLADRASALLANRPVVPVSSGGIGLLLALHALVGTPGAGRRQVLLPSFTFAACAAAVVWCGLEPVFCDIDEDGWHLSPDKLREALDEREGKVAAVLACSTFGTPVPADQSKAWSTLTEQAGIPLLVDSAAGFGAVHSAPPPDAEMFSLHATKPLPIGEGGLVALRDEAIAQRLRILVNHGLDGAQVAVAVGLNGKLDEWHSATALAGLDRLEATMSARRSHAAVLRRELSGDGVRFQARAEGSATQFVPALMPSAEARDRVLAAAGSAGVQVRTYFRPPLHATPAYASCDRAGTLDVTDTVSRRIVSLPMATDLTHSELERIAACIKTCC